MPEAQGRRTVAENPMAIEVESIEDLDEARLPIGKLVGVGATQPVQDSADECYFPPTDPVLIGEDIVGGFSHTSMDELVVEPSTIDGIAGDEALADAVRQELRADAATSALDIEVAVEDRVAYLHGHVSGIEDVENVEEVASRIPEIDEVVEELDVTS
jgi:BON domain